MYVYVTGYVTCAYTGRRGHQITWNKSYGWLGGTMWVLGTQRGPPVRTSPLNCRAISPASKFGTFEVKCTEKLTGLYLLYSTAHQVKENIC